MTFNLELLPDTFAICRLDPDAPIPDWAEGNFVSITRTRDELSIVCRQEHVPDDVQAERGWRCLRVVGKDGKRTHIGEQDGKSGLCKVLTQGNPSSVKMIARAVR